MHSDFRRAGICFQLKHNTRPPVSYAPPPVCPTPNRNDERLDLDRLKYWELCICRDFGMADVASHPALKDGLIHRRDETKIESNENVSSRSCTHVEPIGRGYRPGHAGSGPKQGGAVTPLNFQFEIESMSFKLTAAP